MPPYEIKSKKNFFANLSATNQIIILTILIFLITLFTNFFNNSDCSQTICKYIALTPSYIFAGKYFWTFLTSMFAHAGFFHIFANMFSLFFVGNFLERIIGKRRFYLIYLIAGIVGGLFFVSLAYLFGNSFIGTILFGSPNISGIGASGAIFGLIGVLAVLVPYSRIYLLVGPLILIIIEAIPVLGQYTFIVFIINILFILMIFSLFSTNLALRKISIPVELRMWLLPIVAIVPLIIIGFIVPLPIANSAHIGGLVAGLCYGFYLRKKFPNKTMKLRNHFR